MTTEELKAKLSEAREPEWFKTISLKLNFKTIKVNVNLEEFSSIYLYFQAQLIGWEKLKPNNPQELNKSYNFFNTAFHLLDNIASNADHLDKNELQNHWNEVGNAIAGHNQQQVFTYDCPETEFIIRVNKTQPKYVNSAFNFLIAAKNNQSIEPHQTNNLIGYLLAYEFIQKDHTEITKRRNAEKASLTRLRNEFKDYLSKSENQLNDFLNESKKKSEDYSKAIDEIKVSKETNYNEWIETAKKDHNDFVNETNDHRNDLEKTYRELLRLKEPANYWQQRAKKLRRQGWISMAGLILLVIIGAGSLFTLLILLPGDILERIFETTGKAIKWSIVFISFVSFIAYGIGLLAKVSFSAFHLSRDAEEREQLTYLYLSLKQDGNIEEKDRQLILQSLFSRTDSGLIKSDASPTMPGASNLLKNFVSDK